MLLERFNAEIKINVISLMHKKRLVIDQANAQWRRQIATADTAAVNAAAME